MLLSVSHLPSPQVLGPQDWKVRGLVAKLVYKFFMTPWSGQDSLGSNFLGV